MANALRSQLSELATSLVEAVFAAARSAPLDELIADPRGGRGEPHRNGAATSKPRWAQESSGQAPRRLADETAKTLELVFLLLRAHKDGLRAEQLREKLGVDTREMPRVLKLGLVTQKLTRKGQKRATTYFAATSPIP